MPAQSVTMCILAVDLIVDCMVWHIFMIECQQIWEQRVSWSTVEDERMMLLPTGHPSLLPILTQEPTFVLWPGSQQLIEARCRKEDQGTRFLVQELREFKCL